MPEYIHLVGAEEVSRAASRMIHAAEEMNRAVANLGGIVHQTRMFLDDYLIRLEQVLKENRDERSA